MRILMKWLGRLLIVFVLAGAVAVWFGPRVMVDRVIDFDAATLPSDPAELDTYLATAEAKVPALRDGAEKRIVWAGDAGAVTPISLVYLHGFSAAAPEIQPVPELVAEALGANLHYTRLTGHGRDGPAMAEATAGAWVEDTAEAIEIGRRIGERVIVIGTSTGGTLATLAAHDTLLGGDVAGLVLVSPNFAVNNPMAPLLTLPWAEIWLTPLAGTERSFEPHNEAHGTHWTTQYPSTAVFPMAALVEHAYGLDHSRAKLPALFLYSEHDRVVSAAATTEVHNAWGSAADRVTFVMGPGDDPYSHVIAGDILSPGQTEKAAQAITDWIRSLD